MGILFPKYHWREGETLRKYLADSYGCEAEELEIYLYRGAHRN